MFWYSFNAIVSVMPLLFILHLDTIIWHGTTFHNFLRAIASLIYIVIGYCIQQLCTVFVREHAHVFPAMHFRFRRDNLINVQATCSSFRVAGYPVVNNSCCMLFVSIRAFFKMPLKVQRVWIGQKLIYAVYAL